MVKNIYDKLNEIGEEIVKDMANIITKKNAIASGNLLRSLSYDVEFSKDGKWELIIEYADYGYFVDKGRNPGKFPPGPAIKNWMSRKGIPAEAFWAIMTKIKKAGYYSKMVGGVPLSPARGIRFTDPFTYNIELSKLKKEFGELFAADIKKEITK